MSPGPGNFVRALCIEQAKKYADPGATVPFFLYFALKFLHLLMSVYVHVEVGGIGSLLPLCGC